MFGQLFETRSESVLWGVAPTGEPHIGYLPYLLALSRATRSGDAAVLVIADFHAVWDDKKSSWQELDSKREAYLKTLSRLVPKATIVHTNALYCSAEYISCLFRRAEDFRVDELLSAANGTLRSLEHPRASDLLYVLTQVVDVEFLRATRVLCGSDEAPIYEAAQRHARTPWELVTLPMCPGVVSAEMHCSAAEENKILLTDSPSAVREKLMMHAEFSKDLVGVPPLFAYVSALGTDVGVRSAEIGKLRDPESAATTLLLLRDQLG